MVKLDLVELGEDFKSCLLVLTAGWWGVKMKFPLVWVSLLIKLSELVVVALSWVLVVAFYFGC